jgi:hypothetical protein
MCPTRDPIVLEYSSGLFVGVPVTARLGRQALVCIGGIFGGTYTMAAATSTPPLHEPVQ